MNAIERVVMKWRSDGIGPNPGASEAMIDRLERQVGTTLPTDVRSFFRLADGIEDGYTDEYLLSFWSIDKILRDVADSVKAVYTIDPRDTPMADFLINSWFLYLRRLGEGRVGIWVEGADVELPSLT